jgi:hypothetical protein
LHPETVVSGYCDTELIPCTLISFLPLTISIAQQTLQGVCQQGAAMRQHPLITVPIGGTLAKADFFGAKVKGIIDATARKRRQHTKAWAGDPQAEDIGQTGRIA